MYFVDIQGTLIDDKNRLPIDGAIEFIDSLNEKKVPYILVTNNSKHKSEEFFKNLVEMGFNIKFENYIDPFFILQEKVKYRNLALFGDKEFRDTVVSLGYLPEYKEPDALVVSVSSDYSSDDFASMIEIALKCDSLIAMHGTSTYSKYGRRYPGVGAIMEMVKFASNKGYSVVGKPSTDFFISAKTKLEHTYGLENIDFKDITIISDDMIGDILGAKKLGMKSIFVLSGKIKDADEIIPTLNDEEKPDMIYKSVAEVKI